MAKVKFTKLFEDEEELEKNKANLESSENVEESSENVEKATDTDENSDKVEDSTENVDSDSEDDSDEVDLDSTNDDDFSSGTDKDGVKNFKIGNSEYNKVFERWMSKNDATFKFEKFAEWEEYFGYDSRGVAKESVKVFFTTKTGKFKIGDIVKKEDDPDLFEKVCKLNELSIYKICKDVYDQKVKPKLATLQELTIQGTDGNDSLSDPKVKSKMNTEINAALNIARSEEPVNVQIDGLGSYTVPTNIIIFLYSKIASSIVSMTYGKNARFPYSYVQVCKDDNVFSKLFKFGKEAAGKDVGDDYESKVSDVLMDGLAVFLGGVPYASAGYVTVQRCRLGQAGGASNTIFDDGSEKSKIEGNTNQLIALLNNYDTVLSISDETLGDVSTDDRIKNGKGRHKALGDSGLALETIRHANLDDTLKAIDDALEADKINQEEANAAKASAIEINNETTLRKNVSHPFARIAIAICGKVMNLYSSIERIGFKNHVKPSMQGKFNQMKGAPYFSKEQLMEQQKEAELAAREGRAEVPYSGKRGTKSFTYQEMLDANSLWDSLIVETSSLNNKIMGKDGSTQEVMDTISSDGLSDKSESYNDYKEDVTPEDLEDAFNMLISEFSRRYSVMVRGRESLEKIGNPSKEQIQSITKVIDGAMFDMRLCYELLNYPSMKIKDAVLMATGSITKGTNKRQYATHAGLTNLTLAGIAEGLLNQGLGNFVGLKNSKIRNALLCLGGKEGKLFINGGDSHGISINGGDPDEFVFDSFKKKINSIYVNTKKVFDSIMTKYNLADGNIIDFLANGLYNGKSDMHIGELPVNIFTDLEGKTPGAGELASVGKKGSGYLAAGGINNADDKGKLDKKSVKLSINPVQDAVSYSLVQGKDKKNELRNKFNKLSTQSPIRFDGAGTLTTSNETEFNPLYYTDTPEGRKPATPTYFNVDTGEDIPSYKKTVHPNGKLAYPSIDESTERLDDWIKNLLKD